MANEQKSQSGNVNINDVSGSLVVGNDLVAGDKSVHQNIIIISNPDEHAGALSRLQKATDEYLAVLSGIAVPPSQFLLLARIRPDSAQKLPSYLKVDDLFKCYANWRLCAVPLLGEESQAIFEQFENDVTQLPDSSTAANWIRSISDILKLVQSGK